MSEHHETVPGIEDASPAARTLRQPSRGTLEIARDIKDRVGKRTTAPVRVAFIGARDARRDDSAPPMARILRGGRGGDVRLKLELSFLWFAVSPPHDLAYPARAWALLLGLDGPEGKGVRRVRQGIAALRDAGLVAVEPMPGRPGRIFLLDESGSTERYTLPGGEYSKVRGSDEAWRHRYVQLPDTLWTNGWIATLSGASIAMLLVLFAELGGRAPGTTDVWFSPRVALDTYGLSEDTRSKGLRELRAAGIVSARRKAVARSGLDFRRVRNTYRLNLARLSDAAEVPENPDPDPPLTVSEAAVDDLFNSLVGTRVKARKLGPDSLGT